MTTMELQVEPAPEMDTAVRRNTPSHPGPGDHRVEEQMNRTDHYIAGINQAIGAGREDVATSLADEYAALTGVAAPLPPRVRHDRAAYLRAGRGGRLRRPAESRR
jgi:hypothetical protein